MEVPSQTGIGVARPLGDAAVNRKVVISYLILVVLILSQGGFWYLLESTIKIQCVHGDCVEYPLAEVDIAVNDKHFEILAGVAERLPAAMLHGKDVPGLWDLLGQEQAEKALVVTTRVATKH